MAIHYRTQGFILKKTDSGEADRVFTVFTKKFGKLEILARAIRKIGSKLRGGMELFYLSDIEFIQGKTYKTLTDAILVNNFQNLRKDLKTLKIAQDISEMIDSLIKGEERDEEVWNLLDATFQELNRVSLSIKECWLTYYYFLWNFLSVLGYKPQLNICSTCQRKLVLPNIYPVRDNQIFGEKERKQISNGVYFSQKEGGTICSVCFKKTKEGKKVLPDVVKILRLFLGKDLNFLKKLKIKKEYQKAVKELSEDYLAYIIESQL